MVREQFVQAFGIVVVIIVDPGQEVNQPIPEVNPMSLAATKHRVHNGGIFGSLVVAAEQPRLSSHRHRPDRVFTEIVIHFKPSVQMVTGQFVVHAVGVVDLILPFFQPPGLVIKLRDKTLNIFFFDFSYIH